MKISEAEIQQNLCNLFKAIESAENALEIYTTRDLDISGIQNNIYGQALQEFQLGYLYMKHSKALTSPITHQYAKASGDEFT